MLRGRLWQQEAQQVVDAHARPDPERYHEALVRLHRDFPLSSRVLRNLAVAQFDLGKKEAAAASLREYASMGMTLNLEIPDFAKLKESGITREIPDLQRNHEPANQGRRLFGAPDASLLVEDIAYDPKTDRFILSSVHERKLITCDRGGRCRDYFAGRTDTWAFLALRVDARRHVLWATTAGMDAASGFTPAEDGRSALLKFDLDSGRLVKRYEPADGKPHALGDLTVSSKGAVYVSDGRSGDVYTLSAKGSLEPLVPAGVFISPQTPALSADERRLYVPDYVEGIAVIDLQSKRVQWLTSTIPVATEGVDGLYCSGDMLIAVQNGTQPPRIATFHLATPTTIDHSETVEANWPGLGTPTHGVVVNDQFYFIANSGWDRSDAGKLSAGPPAEVWQIALPQRSPHLHTD